MLRHIKIKNPRSIRDQEVEISPLTILYGPNGSGKSTLMHALAILKNVILNPNQPLDGFFNLSFANFGGFEQVVFNHIPEALIELEIGLMKDSDRVTYTVSLGKQEGKLLIRAGDPWSVNLEIETVFPYPANKQQRATVEHQGTMFIVSWNGILAQVTIGTTSEPTGLLSDQELKTMEEAQKKAQILTALLNSPIEEPRRSDFVHLRRGFSKPHYQTVPLTPVILAEEEVATILASDQYLEGKVSHYLEQILQRELRVRTAPGTTPFWLNTTDKATGLSTELVNDGFGINQVVYLLAKTLRSDTSIVCIEEPEIHLHPRALRNLAHAFVKLTKEENKTLIVSTHNEHFVLSLLSAVAQGRLSPHEISCYLCTKSNGESRFERQRVKSNGQIEGGLTTFMERELEDLKDILGLSKAVE